MSHVRKQIRDAVAADLAPVATTHVARVYPVEQTALPVLCWMGNGRRRSSPTSSRSRCARTSPPTATDRRVSCDG